jgi:dihydrofolate reductase
MGHDDFGRRMNQIPKYVVSGTLADSDATWGETTIIRGDAAAQIARLKDQPKDALLLVEGSCQLTRTLIEHGLVDEYRLMVFPVILGHGKRLFPDQMTQPAALALAESRTAGDGVLLLTYHPATAQPPG